MINSAQEPVDQELLDDFYADFRESQENCDNLLLEPRKRTMRSHLRTGYDLLHRMAEWQEGGEIVLQHHEHIDGCGYTKKLTGLEICDGAKILAIADTFEARTHERAHTISTKRLLFGQYSN